MVQRQHFTLFEYKNIKQSRKGEKNAADIFTNDMINI